MRYSDIELTDDNFDEEYEKLTDLIGNLNSDEWEVYDTLPSGFTKQESECENRVKRGFSEYVKSGVIRFDHTNQNQCLCSGEVAYEFKNKFISLHFNEAI